MSTLPPERSTGPLVIAEHEGWAEIRVNREDKRNAMDRASRVALLDSFEALRGRAKAIILTGTGTMDYDGWAGEYLLEGPAASPSANPSGDGVDNLLKYAFNLSPLTSNPAELVPGTGLSGLPRLSTTFSGPAPVWRYEFIRRRGTGLTYTPEKSSALGTWTALASEPTVTAIDDTWERVVHEEPLPPTETRQFGRVNVSAP
jgi:hypothetical protein